MFKNMNAHSEIGLPRDFEAAQRLACLIYIYHEGPGACFTERTTHIESTNKLIVIDVWGKVNDSYDDSIQLK